jgi:hypothetical protein
MPRKGSGGTVQTVSVRVRAPTSSNRPSWLCRITTRLASHARRWDVSCETCGSSGRVSHEQDLIAELLQPTNVVATKPGRAAPVEVGGAEILMRDAAGEHVPQRHEHGVLHVDDGLLGSPAGFQAVVKRVVVATLGSGGGPSRLLEGAGASRCHIDR